MLKVGTKNVTDAFVGVQRKVYDDWIFDSEADFVGAKRYAIPEGFTQIEYIESDGNLAFESGISPTLETEMEGIFDTRNYRGTTFNWTMGGRGSDGNLGFSTQQQSNSIGYRVGSATGSVSTSSTYYAKNNFFYCKLTTSSQTVTTYKGNTITKTFTKPTIDKIDVGQTLSIGRHYGPNAIESLSEGIRLHVFRITESGETVCLLVPVIRDEDGVIGMYDIVSGEFRENRKEAQLIAGRAVATVEPKRVVRMLYNGEVVFGRPIPQFKGLTFIAEEPNSTITAPSATATEYNWEVSTDGRNWTPYTETITLANEGDWVLFRGNGCNSNENDNFTMSGKLKAQGSAMSLVDGVGETTVIPSGQQLSHLFYGCKSLTQAPELPATTLTEKCYSYMFYACTGLTKAPELPATTLATNCYNRMFYACTGLTSAPELPATTLKENCYTMMFQGCTALTKAPELPATTLALNCYSNMFNGCTALTKAPELPATTLKENCYKYMFYGCTNLSDATTYVIDYLTQSSNWMDSVPPNGVFHNNGMATASRDANGIPSGWKVVADFNNKGLVGTLDLSSKYMGTIDELNVSDNQGLTSIICGRMDSSCTVTYDIHNTQVDGGALLESIDTNWVDKGDTTIKDNKPFTFGGKTYTPTTSDFQGNYVKFTTNRFGEFVLDSMNLYTES